MNEDMVSELNELSRADCIEAFKRCCGAMTWCKKLTERRPFDGFESLTNFAEQVFDELTENDWLEAFTCHPKIGDVNSLRMKFAGNKDWSAGEQSGVNAADENTIQSLANENVAYELR